VPGGPSSDGQRDGLALSPRLFAVLWICMRILIVAVALAAAACGPASEAGGITEYTYEIIHTYPHDPSAFTQGLFYLNGFLYESTGQHGQSSVRKETLETSQVLQKHDIPEQYFGEGIVNWKDRLLELTWQAQVGFIYDLNTFQLKSEYHYPGEGWGLTQDGKRIIMSDGTAQLRFWDPETLRELGRITVTADGAPVVNLNELEYVKGEIYANVWQTDRIARIDPKTGKVVGWINCAGLLSDSEKGGGEDVLNGIAYDAAHDRLFVTGKLWPKLFEIRLKKVAAADR
jgi:glutamine cyclotransferase